MTARARPASTSPRRAPAWVKGRQCDCGLEARHGIQPPAAALLTVGLLAIAMIGCSERAEPVQAPERRQVDLLVLGGTLVTMDAAGSVFPAGALAVDDGEIVAVGPASELGNRYEADELVTAAAHDIVLPGLVNGHGHAAMTLFRGLADDLRLMEWLERYIFPAEAALVDEGFVRLGTQLAAMEMVRGGTTTFVDMYYFEDVVAEVTAEAGLRGVLGETILDFPAPDNETVDAALRYTEAFLERWSGHPLVIAAVAPHAAYTASPETLRRSAELARAHGAPLVIHVAESRDSVADVRQRYGAPPVQHLQALGFLGPDVIAAHAIWLDDADIDLLATAGAGVVHNPESNMKLASGTMRVGDLQAAGVPVGLGTDGAASNNDLDMFEAVRFAALLQKLAGSDPTALPAEAALAMATLEGARAIGLDDRIGSLEVGKRADLIVVDGEGAHQVPRYSPTSHLAYVTRGSDVRITIVDGRILYRDGAFTTLDEDAVRSAARAMAARIAETVGAR